MKTLVIATALTLAVGTAGLATIIFGNKGGATTEATTATSTVITVPTVVIAGGSSAVANVFGGEKKVEKLTLPSSRTLYLLGEVGNNSVALSKSILKLSNKSNDPIYLIIDSPGGSVIRGALVISAIEASKAPVYTICYNICASMATQIHAHGVKRYAVDRAILMYHWATAGTQGDVNRMLSFSEFVVRYVDKMDAYVMKRSGMDPNAYAMFVAKDMWRDAEDALALNLIDGLVSLDTENKDLFGGDLEEKLNYIKHIKDNTMKQQLQW